MAIWITKERATVGPVFGSADRFEGLGIFIDTYKNARPGVVFPYVMAMLGNSSTTYDKDHDGKANELAGCSVDLVIPGPGRTNDIILSRRAVFDKRRSQQRCGSRIFKSNH